MPPTRLSWAALATLVATSGCSWISGGSCDTDNLPPSDPCFMRDCCETVNVIRLPDGGFVEVPAGSDAGVATETRFCGSCNG
jgi:hypothetical protein